VALVTNGSACVNSGDYWRSVSEWVVMVVVVVETTTYQVVAVDFGNSDKVHHDEAQIGGLSPFSINFVSGKGLRAPYKSVFAQPYEKYA
jgi:hypothetical protein